jgi:hypothetical protein
MARDARLAHQVNQVQGLAHQVNQVHGEQGLAHQVNQVHGQPGASGGRGPGGYPSTRLGQVSKTEGTPPHFQIFIF